MVVTETVMTAVAGAGGGAGVLKFLQWLVPVIREFRKGEPKLVVPITNGNGGASRPLWRTLEALEQTTARGNEVLTKLAESLEALHQKAERDQQFWTTYMSDDRQHRDAVTTKMIAALERIGAKTNRRRGRQEKDE